MTCLVTLRAAMETTSKLLCAEGTGAPTRQPPTSRVVRLSSALDRGLETKLWDAVSGRFDPGRLRAAIVARGWTVPEFVGVSTASRSSLYKALRGYAVGDRTVIRILEALEQRAPSTLLDT